MDFPCTIGIRVLSKITGVENSRNIIFVTFDILSAIGSKHFLYVLGHFDFMSINFTHAQAGITESTV